MPADSTRRGAGVLQVLVAMLFLAVIGGSAGFLAAHRQKQREAAVHATQQPSTPPSPSPVPSPSASGVECPAHAETLAAAGPLRQLLYIHTVSSEVWICQDANGNLYYQGHLGQPGQDLVEGVNALFLTTTTREGTDGYVATNVDPKTGRVTKYHVTPRSLRREYVGHPPDAYESALPN